MAGRISPRHVHLVNPVNPVQDFPLAAEGTSIAKIRFNGDGVLRSITGEYVVAEAFRTAAARAIDATLSDDDFSDGETATATIPKSGGDIFFKATIE